MIGSGVISIGWGAFEGCNEAIYDTETIPGVRLVDGWAVSCDYSFSGELDLTGIRGIGDGAFCGSAGISNVTIPGNVSKIGNSAFAYCEGLRSVTVSDSVTSIGNWAFEGCSGLTSVTIGNITNIGYYAFCGCSSLTNVTFRGNAPEVGFAAFSDMAFECVAYVPLSSIGWDDDGDGMWQGLRLVYVADDAIPEIDEKSDASVVDAAVDGVGFADEGVKAAIGGSAAEYGKFKEWAGSVKGTGSTSGAAAGEAAVVANTNAAAAYLLGAERLFENAPKVEFGEVSVADGEGGGLGTSRPTMMVSVTVKDGEEAVKCTAEKVKEMFEATSDLGDWADGGRAAGSASQPYQNALPVAVEVEAGEGATMRFKVTPGDSTATRAFLRIRK